MMMMAMRKKQNEEKEKQTNESCGTKFPIAREKIWKTRKVRERVSQ